MAVADLSDLVLEKELGRGAQTSVFRARRGADRYAVKVLRGAAADAPDAVLDLRREAALLASLDHPGILRTYASGLHEGRPALVTELVPGDSLADLLAHGPLPVDRVVRLALELADALAAAHEGGVVHRDLKPQNVMVPPTGPAKLIDFGLAGLASQPSDADTAMGTFVYASPEQTGMLKRPVDHRSDLYSLGVVLFECLAGRPPFLADDVGELLRMHAVQAVPDVCEIRPDAGSEVGAVIGRLLAKDPDDRYRSAPELLADLARVGGSDPAAPVPASHRRPLCGRQAEMDQLRTRWQSARAGRGGMALVRGPAGGGKSHLARALADAVDGVVLSARCSRDGGPLAAVREAVETYLGKLPPGDPARRRVRDAAMTAGPGLLKALSARLAALLADVPDPAAPAGNDQFAEIVAVFLAELARGDDGALLVLDDAHDLDERSGQVLARLADLLPNAPMLVVLTAAEGASAAPLRAAYGAALDTEVVAGALGQGATAELISSRLPGAAVNPALTAHVLARTGGLPLAVVEYLRLLVDKAVLSPYWGTWRLDDSRLDTLPAAGRDLLASRLADLPAATVEVLVVAACMGSRFRADVVAAAAEKPGDVAAAIEAATAQRLIEVRQDGRYGFAHAGVRTALLDSADEVRVRRLHRRIAQVLEEQDPATRDAEHAYAVAEHYLRGAVAGDEAAMYRSLVAAAQKALADGSPAEALRFLERAEETARAGGLPVAPEVRHGIVTAYLRMGRVEAARDRIEETLRTETDPGWRVKLWSAMAEVHAIEYEDDRAVEAASTALSELGHAVPRGRLRLAVSTVGAAVAGALVRRTGIGFGTVRGRQREEYLVRASLLEACAYGSAVGMRILHLAVYVMRALYLVNRLGAGRHYVRAYALLGLVPALVGLRRPAERCWTRAAHAARELADPALVAFVDWVRGTGLLFGGHDDGGAWEKAVDEHARWLAPAQLLGGFGTVVMRLLLRGRPNEAAAALQRCEAMLPGAAGRINGTSIGMARVMVPAQQGHNGEAAAALATMRAAFADGGGTVQQRANVAVATLHSLVEQGEFGAPFDEAVAEFEAIGMRRSEMMAIHKYFFLFRAHGRLAQCRLSPPGELSSRLAVAREAIADLRRNAGTPLLKVGHGLTRAALFQLTGDHVAALKLADRMEHRARPLDSPLAILEASRIRARALRALGMTGEAQRQARWAYSVAAFYGLDRRAQQVRAEFGEMESGTAAGGTSQRTRERARDRDLEAMQRVALAAATVLDPQELARVTLAETLRIFGAERALFFLVGDDDRLALYAGLDSTGAELDAVSDYGSTLLRRVRESGEPLVLTGTEEGAALGSRSVVAHGLRSIMVAPVQLKGRLLGVVYLDSRLARGVFTDEDIDVLATVTSHVAVALQTARAAQLELAVQVAIRQQELAETLRSSLAELSAILDPQEVLHRLAGTLVEQAGAGRSCLLRAGADMFTVVATTGPDTASHGQEVDLAADVQAAELVTTALVSGGWASTAPGVVAELLGNPAAWLAVPLHGRDGLVAVLFLGGDHFDDGHRQVVSTLAGQGMSAYDNAELFSRVERLATTDGLTGVANRRHAFQLGETLFGVARRSGRPLTAVMVDIDHFKGINDRYGHACGDDVIREVAARLGAVIRSSDILGRYGGEEFLIILPEAGTGGAELAERMREAVAAEPVPTRDGPVPVTISVGLAGLAADDDTLDTLVARADHGLYLAKEGGRNRVAAA
ncbi:diguanylate cyclase [Actinoplanes sp. NPDC049548]|uniref:diguanylate cyclase n=1 Tax=Actinoplanes sp. NPDC049548 TaxID=3155152 RepID=UPI0034340729